MTTKFDKHKIIELLESELGKSNAEGNFYYHWVINNRKLRVLVLSETKIGIVIRDTSENYKILFSGTMYDMINNFSIIIQILEIFRVKEPIVEASS